jgi:hypothetical protein
MSKFIIAVVLTLVLLFGCSKPPLSDTQVLDKQYEPASVTMIMMPIMIGKSIMFIPYTIYDDEDFVLNVMGYTDDGDRKCRRIYVDKGRYESTNVGDRVDDLTMQYKDEHRREKR